MTLWTHKKMSIKLSVMLYASRISILNNVLLYSRKMNLDICCTPQDSPYCHNEQVFFTWKMKLRLTTTPLEMERDGGKMVRTHGPDPVDI